MPAPLVSVVISTFNSAICLRACLRQLLAQDALPQSEVIVIDSGSEQDESAVCSAMASEFPCLRYERTPRETIYAAWNRALAIARGTYFVNVNADDSIHPNCLSLMTLALDTHTECAVAYGDWLWADVPNAPYPWNTTFRRCRHAPYDPATPLFYCFTGCIQFWRTARLREIGGFNAARHAAGDYEAACALIPRRWSAIYVPEPVAAYYQNPRGLSRSTNRSITEFYEIRDAVRASLRISDVFAVDEDDARACAAGWLALAQRAMTFSVPWATTRKPDVTFALACVDKALSLEPDNAQARRARNVIPSHQWRHLHRILSRLGITRPDLLLPPYDDLPYRVGGAAFNRQD
ncbi:MAG: glycosyltransferase [Planctomycetia bacterium]|nr:glycosyltransferase [Planctomycetia bacterium]